MQRLNIIYKGKVQGVGFRFTVEHIAAGLGLTGWVRNKRDGSVEITAEGEEQKLNLLLEQIEEAFTAYIRGKEIDWFPATGEFPDFRIVL